MFEKRTNDRSPIELAASYGIGEDPRPEREAKVNNISSGGLCLTSDHKMGMGEGIELVVEIDSRTDITVFAEVVWIKKEEGKEKYTVGVQILEKEGEHYERFLDFYNQQI